MLFYMDNSELALSEDTVIRKSPDVASQLLIHLISGLTVNVLGWRHSTILNSNVLNDKPRLRSDRVSLNFKANTLSQLNP